jgi:hypothetical protein
VKVVALRLTCDETAAAASRLGCIKLDSDMPPVGASLRHLETNRESSSTQEEDRPQGRREEEGSRRREESRDEARRCEEPRCDAEDRGQDIGEEELEKGCERKEGCRVQEDAREKRFAQHIGQTRGAVGIAPARNAAVDV